LAFRNLDSSPSSVKGLAKPIEELVDYYAFARTHELDNEQAKCLSRFRAILVRQIGVVLSKSADANADWMIRAAPEKKTVKWMSLVPVDWLRVCQSLLLLSNDKLFCDSFGREAMLLDDAKHKWMTFAASAEPSCFGDCPNCFKSSLDFNSFCGQCQNFVSPLQCDPLQELLTISGCHKCHRESCTGYNCYHSSSTAAPVSRVGLVVSSSARRDYVNLHCHEGCSGELSANRFCEKCSVIYCLKGSSRSRQCFLCGNQLKGGRCSSPSCGARKLTWKELPYASLLDFLGEEYDEKDGVFKAKYLKGDELVACLEVPCNPSDPSHFGHVAWKYCRFRESQLSTKKVSSEFTLSAPLNVQVNQDNAQHSASGMQQS
jgi:hypothetical protein